MWRPTAICKTREEASGREIRLVVAARGWMKLSCSVRLFVSERCSRGVPLYSESTRTSGECFFLSYTVRARFRRPNFFLSYTVSLPWLHMVVGGTSLVTHERNFPRQCTAEEGALVAIYTSVFGTVGHGRSGVGRRHVGLSGWVGVAAATPRASIGGPHPQASARRSWSEKEEARRGR